MPAVLSPAAMDPKGESARGEGEGEGDDLDLNLSLQPTLAPEPEPEVMGTSWSRACEPARRPGLLRDACKHVSRVQPTNQPLSSLFLTSLCR